MQWLVKVGLGLYLQESSIRGYGGQFTVLGRIAKWCTVLGAFDTICMHRTPVKVQILANLVTSLTGPLLEEGAVMRSDSRGLYGETSFGRYISISSALLKRLDGALAMTGPQTSYFRGIITHTDNYLSVRQN